MGLLSPDSKRVTFGKTTQVATELAFAKKMSRTWRRLANRGGGRSSGGKDRKARGGSGKFRRQRSGGSGGLSRGASGDRGRGNGGDSDSDSSSDSSSCGTGVNSLPWPLPVPLPEDDGPHLNGPIMLSASTLASVDMDRLIGLPMQYLLYVRIQAHG